ncbi:MAG TPA: hypothetical protein VLD67_15300, partial [Vicinamibacterales bacterium]|nr:hypothetical protein [Vicinamibacterales bacterium]
MLVLILWPLMAFGGTHASTAVPFGIACVVCALVVRPRLRGQLDAALLLLLSTVALQLTPLPAALVQLLSPHAGSVREALTLDPGATRTSLWPLTIDDRSTVWALVEAAGAVALFFAARGQLERGGVRRVVRGIIGIGFAASVLAIAHAATGSRDIYWLFETDVEGPHPFGPFVNRNHFAMW